MVTLLRLVFLMCFQCSLATAYAQQQGTVAPAEAIVRLKEGNSRFVAGTSLRPRQSPQHVKEVAQGQKPFAIVVGCSDSRVPNEIIFDQGLGDLFIVRTAGQVSAAASYASIEFAEEVLGAKLIVVLGHTKCGAVAAACDYEKPVQGHIQTLVNAIKPAVLKVRAHGVEKHEELNATVEENVKLQVEQLKSLEPLLARRVREGTVKIIGAVYEVDSGKVRFLED